MESDTKLQQIEARLKGIETNCRVAAWCGTMCFVLLLIVGFKVSF